MSNFFWSHSGIISPTGDSHPRWNYSAVNEGVDTFGFNALPGGTRYGNGTFVNIGDYGRWWSATECNTSNAWFRLMGYGSSNVGRNYSSKELGFSVRLIRAYNSSTDGVISDGTVLSNTFSDSDSNTYDGVKIGNQVWSTTNLKTTRYLNTDLIPTNLTDEQWNNTTSGACAIYDHTLVEGINSDAEMVDAYGRLYNWYAVNDSRGFSSQGNVPTDAEWFELTSYLVNSYPEINNTNVGRHLKSTRTAGP